MEEWKIKYWSIKNVKDWKKKLRKRRNREALSALIWYTETIGIFNITDENYLRFYARVAAWENIKEPYYYNGKSKRTIPSYITLQDVEMWIGLWTRSSRQTAAEFEKLVSYIEKEG